MPTNTIDKNVQIAVDVRPAWNEPWVEVPLLFCESASRLAWPGIGAATLRIEVGKIKQHTTTGQEFPYYAPNSYLNYFVRIRFRRMDDDIPGPWVKFFYGLIVDAADVVWRAGSESSGIQTYFARELSILLDREKVLNARCRHMDDTDPVTIEWMPTFNRVKKGMEGGLTGNRFDTAETEVPFTDGFVFTDKPGSKEVWNGTQAMDYLLGHFSFLNLDHPELLPEFFLSGIEVTYEDVWDASGQTYWQSLGLIVPRRRGLGICVEVQEEEDPELPEFVNIHVFSLSDVDITVGGETFPMSDRQGDFTIPDFPFNQTIEPITYRYSSSGRYSKIIVRGDRPKILASFSVKSGTLVKGWSDDDETTYRDMSGADEAEADQKRANDRDVEYVFRRFTLDPEWDGKVDNPEVEDPDGWCFPTLEEDGAFDFDTPAPFVWLDRRMERNTTLKKKFDYSVLPPVDGNDPNTEPEFRTIVAYIHDTDDGEEHTATDRWHRLDKIDAIDGVNWTPSIRPDDRVPGIWIDGNPPHRLALNHWDAEEDESKVQPEFDWENIAVTCVMLHDQRFRIENELDPELSPGLIPQPLIVDLPKLQLWLAAKGAIFAIDEDGELAEVADAGTVDAILRDDRDKLKEVAAALTAWYGVVRQSINLKINRVADYGAPVGYLINNIVSEDATVAVNAVVTGIHWNFKGGRSVSFETGYGSYDYAPDFTRAYL